MHLRVCALLLLAGCAREPAPAGNVLILLADDIGTGELACYGERAGLAATPSLDRLARAGVVFDHVWANPLCSPTRATIQTGRYSFRTGVGATVGPRDAGLSSAECTLPELLERGSPGVWSHAAIGKWHLGGDDDAAAPNAAGWGHFAGSLGNLVGEQSYFAWTRVEDGRAAPTSTYATTDAVDSALAWIASAREPWLCYVAFHAAHRPLHRPPDALHAIDLSRASAPDDDPRAHYRASIEALDRELGRLLAGIGAKALARTTVMFLADNGTPDFELERFGPLEAETGKGSLHETGICVPLVVTSPLVAAPGRRCDALVNTADLFATLAELAGIDPRAVLPGVRLDSVSLVPYLSDPRAAPQRVTAFAEYFYPNGFAPDYARCAIRSRRYKLVRQSAPQRDELFDLLSEAGEERDLLGAPLDREAAKQYRGLARALEGLLASR